MERNPNFGNLKIREVSPISNRAGKEKWGLVCKKKKKKK